MFLKSVILLPILVSANVPFERTCRPTKLDIKAQNSQLSNVAHFLSESFKAGIVLQTTIETSVAVPLLLLTRMVYSGWIPCLKPICALFRLSYDEMS